MIKAIKYYVGFIKESQKFMKGSMNPIRVFFESLYRGIWFTRHSLRWDKIENKQVAYGMMDRRIEM